MNVWVNKLGPSEPTQAASIPGSAWFWEGHAGLGAIKNLFYGDGKMNEEKQMIVQEQKNFSLQPKNFEEAEKFAKLMAQSDFVPKDYKNKPGNVLVAVQMGLEVGLKPMAALQNIAVINGRPCLWGDAALAVVKNHPEFISIVEDDEETIGKNKKAVCKIRRHDQPEVISTFSVEDAQKARLLGKDGPWKTYPNRMMKMRARGFAMRDSFPDALKGLSVAEEARDCIVVGPQDIPDPVEVATEDQGKSLDEITVEEVKTEPEKPEQEPEPETNESVISEGQVNGLINLIADYDVNEIDVQIILKQHNVTSLEKITPGLYVPITKAISAKGQADAM